MALLKVYEGHFEKQDGDIRNMRFVKLNEVPSELLPESKTKGDSAPKNFSEGVELVWDLDKKGFRAFNWGTVVGIVVEKEEEINQLR